MICKDNEVRKDAFTGNDTGNIKMETGRRLVILTETVRERQR